MIRFPQPKFAAPRFRSAPKSKADRRAFKAARRESLHEASMRAGRPIYPVGDALDFGIRPEVSA
jgi:hypothetical protein